MVAGLLAMGTSSRQAVDAPEAIELQAYLPGVVGDAWRFRVSEEESFTLRLDEASFAGEPAIAIVEDGTGGAIVRFDLERGHQILLLDHGDGTESRFERPVSLLPLALAVGDTQLSQGRYVLREREEGRKKDVGSHYFEVTLEKVETIETPRGTFPDCLVLRTVATRMDYLGTEWHLERRDWLARDVGPVKTESQTRKLSTEGKVLSQRIVEAWLSEVTLGGTARMLPP